MIPFTQYCLPNGAKRRGDLEATQEVTELAQGFIDQGGWFECEILRTGQVSLTACAVVDGEPQDVAIQLCENGPEVSAAVERLVRSVA